MKNTTTLSTSSLLHTDVDALHEWICKHPYFSEISIEVFTVIFQSFRVAEHIHKKDQRKDGSPYILHPIRLVQSVIEKYPDVADPDDSIVLILHDTIEDHPECWWEILSKFGLKIFTDVLLLSKISEAIRKEILEWFVHNTNPDNPDLTILLQILSPLDPIKKFQNFSKYTEDILGENSIRFRNALLIYKMEIIDKDKNQKEAYDEYISLGNYLYFRPNDARRKLQDMLDNMSDMKSMESIKPGYIERRRIKAYILGVKLKNFGMLSEYTQLEYAFQGTGYRMYTDDEVSHKISRKK
ncbi:hypothetical protein HOO68_02830 [Candidatus Gracilibacteria bacterium]|nr:hypothetical protein [Candidatus Gracilibacteria bacterium]